MTDRLERIVSVVLLALAAFVFFAQARSVFVAPQANSVRWFGDETWLMMEAKQHITTGVVRYPLALGTPLTEHKGLALGVSWLSSVLYGIPLALSSGDVVDVGRTVTLIISALTAIAMFACARVLGARMVVAALAVVLLVADRSFLFTSHSARPDMLAGLIVILVFTVAVRWAESRRQFGNGHVMLLGALTSFLLVSSSIHLLTLLSPLLILGVIRAGARGNLRPALLFTAGAILTFCILAIIYYVTTGSLALFASHSSGQFADVLASIPILRPFSRSVQVANLLIRSKQLAAEAPQAFLVIPLAIVAFVRRRERVGIILFAFAIVLLSWLLLQGAEVHYLMHIVPLVLLVTAVLWSRIVRVRADIEALGSMILASALTVLAIRDSNAALINGSRLHRSNERAVSGLFTAIANDWQQPGLPVVITEPPALEGLLKYPLRVSTDHFISFPQYQIPIDQYLDTINADYVVLYNSPAYPKDRPHADPFYQTVRSHARLIDIETGMLGDFGRDYFSRSDVRDTLLLFRWSHAAR